MELEGTYHHACKRPCVRNGHPATKIGRKELRHQDEDEEDAEKTRGRQGWTGISSGSNCLMPWQNHPSSRIYRVSRASGGKDRHSKVYTAKGLRDRRVRLSVPTAIQFYDLQDRLGYDQPSKAIEWLIKAATAAINELPLLDNFLYLPSLHPTDQDKTVDVNTEGDPSYNDQQQQHLPTKSGSSSNSEASKGSVLSLLQSENHDKKREQARERTVKNRDKGRDPAETLPHQRNMVAATSVESNPASIPEQITDVDYFIQSHKKTQLSSSFSASNFGHTAALGMLPFNIAAATVASSGKQSEMHQFSFLQDHLIPVSVAPETGDYNLNFSMSSGFAGFNRGTLQSNSSSQLPHHNHQHHNIHHNHLHQRFSIPIDGSNLPLFFGTAGAAANITEDQFLPVFDGGLQLCYGEGFRHADLKGKRKS